MINKYFEKIENILSGFNNIMISQTIKKRFYNDTQGLISGEIVFSDESILSFLELKNTEQLNKKKYKYHYMNHKKTMIFRYDNSKHYFDLKSFPHHKHLPDKIESSVEPDMIDILLEIQDILSSK